MLRSHDRSHLPKTAHQVFDEADVDSSGKLDTGELDSLLVSLGVKCEEAELKQMIIDADEDDDGEANHLSLRGARSYPLRPCSRLTRTNGN